MLKSDKEKGLPLRTPVPPQRVLVSKVKSSNEKSKTAGQNKPAAPPQRVFLKPQEPRTEVKKTPAPPQRCVQKAPKTCESRATGNVTPPRGVKFPKGSPSTSVRPKSVRTISKTCQSKFPSSDSLSPAKNFNRIRYYFDMAETKKTLTYDDDSEEDRKASTMKTLKAIHRNVSSSSSQAVIKNVAWSERRYASKPVQNATSSTSYDKISLAAKKHGTAIQKPSTVRTGQKGQTGSKLPLVGIKKNISKVNSSEGTSDDTDLKWCKDEVIKQCIGSLKEVFNSTCEPLDLKSEVGNVLEIEEEGSNKYVKMLGQLLTSLRKVKEERERLSKVESAISTLYCYFASHVLEGSSSRSPASTEFERGDSTEAKIRDTLPGESLNPARELEVCDEQCMNTDGSPCEGAIGGDEFGADDSGSGCSDAENKTDASNCDGDAKFLDGCENMSEADEAKCGPSHSLDMDLQTSYLGSSPDKVPINEDSMLDASIMRLLEDDQGHSDSQFDVRGFNPMARLLCDGDDNHFVPVNKEDNTFDDDSMQQ